MRRPEGDEGTRGERGPQGQPGLRGEPGPTGLQEAVTRYSPLREPPSGSNGISYAACATGEVAVGGGLALAGTTPVNSEYRLEADRPSLTVEASGKVTFPAPAEGEPATGWLAILGNQTGAILGFRGYTVCMQANG
ncbi:MAG: hypothetical protein ACRDPE_14500 [Solirubrobacterales bacterium]